MVSIRSAKEADLWLTQQLEKPWSSERVVQVLTNEIVKFSVDSFDALDGQTKVNYLLAFPALRRPVLDAMRSDLDAILSKAERDSDPWVAIIAEILKNTLASPGTAHTTLCTHPDFVKTTECLVGRLKG